MQVAYFDNTDSGKLFCLESFLAPIVPYVMFLFLKITIIESKVQKFVEGFMKI